MLNNYLKKYWLLILGITSLSIFGFFIYTVIKNSQKTSELVTDNESEHVSKIDNQTTVALSQNTNIPKGGLAGLIEEPTTITPAENPPPDQQGNFVPISIENNTFTIKTTSNFEPIVGSDIIYDPSDQTTNSGVITNNDEELSLFLQDEFLRNQLINSPFPTYTVSKNTKNGKYTVVFLNNGESTKIKNLFLTNAPDLQYKIIYTNNL